MNIINKFEKMQIEENGPRKKNTPEKDYIRLHQIFLFYSWEMDRRLKKQKNDPFKFNNQSLFEIYSLLKTRKVYKINSYIMGKFNEIKKNELIMEKEYDKLVNELEIIVELVLKCSNEITEENIGAEEKVYKFWGYNYVYNYIRINSDLFNNEYITKKPNHTGEFVNHYWKDRRQVSDLEKKLNIKMGEKKSLKAVKLYRITETYITPEDNKYRIQVRPEEVTSMIKLGEYDAIFGYLEEKNIYIEFNTIDIVNSKAKNRSLYVYKENIENFLAGKNDKEFMGNIIGIMTKKEFDSKYKIYDKGNEVVEENETKLGGLI